MKRGEVWTLRDEGFAKKARPIVIVQNDETLPFFDSIVLCLLTSFDSSTMPTRVRVLPNRDNGLEKVSYVMTDKVLTVNKEQLGTRVGSLDEKTMSEVSTRLKIVLGIQ